MATAFDPASAPVHVATVTLPRDRTTGTLVGRAWDAVAGTPVDVTIREEGMVAAVGRLIGTTHAVIANSPPTVRDPSWPWLLSPIEGLGGTSSDLPIADGTARAFPVIRLVTDERGEVIGATLGENNSVAPVAGPLVRRFDGTFDAEAAQTALVTLRIVSRDGTIFEATSPVNPSRADAHLLVADDFDSPVLRPDDLVTISTPMLGSLVIHVVARDGAPVALDVS